MTKVNDQPADKVSAFRRGYLSDAGNDLVRSMVNQQRTVNLILKKLIEQHHKGVVPDGTKTETVDDRS